jgi:RND superfamily putative drug exporter
MPASSSRKIAAVAGAWSARHRRKAILGWLGFVLVAILVGTVVGQRYLTDIQQTNGQAKQALAILRKGVPLPLGRAGATARARRGPVR